MNTKHRYILGALFIGHGCLRTMFAMMLLTSNTTLTFSAAILLIGLAVPSLFGGYNLLVGNLSHRQIMPIAALVNLFSFPEGTMISIYYYWFWKYKLGAPSPFTANPIENDTSVSVSQ